MPARIGLDVRWIQQSGIGTTVRELLNHFPEPIFKRLILFGPRGWKNPYPCDVVETPYPFYGLSQHWGYARLLTRYDLALFHMPHYDVPLAYSSPFVATVHDLIHYLFPQWSMKPLTQYYSGFLLKHVAAKARKIICVSEHTQNDLISNFPTARGKTEVIYPGVDPLFHPRPDSDIQPVLDRYALEKGYLLYVGNLRPSKNTKRLLEAYALLRNEIAHCPPLVLVGKNFYSDKDPLLLGANVKHLGSVPYEELPALYAGAGVFIFPSLYEGFGLPPLEAMASGVPVVLSKAASLPEVGGEAAVYVDPNKPEEIASLTAFLLMSSATRDQIKQKGLAQASRFTWEKFAAHTVALYEQALDSR